MNEIKSYKNYDSFSDEYEIDKKIGYGAFSEVFKVRHKAKNIMYAAKVIDMKGFSLKDKQGQIMEVLTLQQMEHPYIVQLVDVFCQVNQFATSANLASIQIIVLVLELADTTLVSKIMVCQKLKIKFSDRQIMYFFIQLLFGLQYLHANNIIHRDIKSENILLFGEADVAKIADFGVAVKGQSNKDVGTPMFKAPEFYTGELYDSLVDVWAAGVVLYQLIQLESPFVGTDQQIEQNVKKLKRVQISGNLQLQQLLDVMLCERSKRYSAAKILELEFVSKYVAELFTEALLQKCCPAAYVEKIAEIQKQQKIVIKPLVNEAIELPKITMKQLSEKQNEKQLEWQIQPKISLTESLSTKNNLQQKSENKSEYMIKEKQTRSQSVLHKSPRMEETINQRKHKLRQMEDLDQQFEDQYIVNRLFQCMQSIFPEFK